VGEVIAVVVGVVAVVAVSVVVAVVDVDVDVTSVDVMPVVSKSDAFIVPPAAAYPVTPRSAVAAVVARTRSGLTNVTFPDRAHGNRGKLRRCLSRSSS
jgi:hypothetical protein